MTNFCKEHKDLQRFPDRWTGDRCFGIIHDTYTNWRRNYKRKVFDPFRRSSTVYFEIDSKPVKSTVAQISFFWFLVVSGVSKVLMERANDISEHQASLGSEKEQATAAPATTAAPHSVAQRRRAQAADVIQIRTQRGRRMGCGLLKHPQQPTQMPGTNNSKGFRLPPAGEKSRANRSPILSIIPGENHGSKTRSVQVVDAFKNGLISRR